MQGAAALSSLSQAWLCHRQGQSWPLEVTCCPRLQAEQAASDSLISFWLWLQRPKFLFSFAFAPWVGFKLCPEVFSLSDASIFSTQHLVPFKFFSYVSFSSPFMQYFSSSQFYEFFLKEKKILEVLQILEAHLGLISPPCPSSLPYPCPSA